MPEQREQGWKQALADYVNLINEANVREDPEPLGAIRDLEHRIRLVRRLRASAKRNRESGIAAMRSELRAKVLRQDTGDREAVAEVELHLLRSWEQHRQPWLEERVERERIRFIRVGSVWRLDRVDPLTHERQAAWMETGQWATTYQEAAGGYGTGVPSLPYLHPKAVNVYGVYAGEWNRGMPYRREEAVAYADRWWNRSNPEYETFPVNCTNYVSQCLFAGGAPMNYTGKRETGWWYKGRQGGRELWSYSWAVANSLAAYLSGKRAVGLRAERVASPWELALGDVICYDWDGTGRYQHTTVVTGFAPDGAPLVNANTVSSRRRYWDYRDSYAWTEGTRYAFFHLADEF
jgi:hypothetical protein